MNGKLLLDTNVVLGLLKGQKADVAFLRKHADYSLYVSVITRMELLSFHSLGKEEEDAIQEFLDAVVVIPLSKDVEDVSINLRRATRRKLPDSIVAASAVVSGAILLTNDRELATTAFPGLKTQSPCND